MAAVRQYILELELEVLLPELISVSPLFFVVQNQQLAASLLQFVKSQMPSACTDPTPDITAEALAGLVALMTAQVQEVILIKAIKGQFFPYLPSFSRYCR
jgi:hypothetical protein